MQIDYPSVPATWYEHQADVIGFTTTNKGLGKGASTVRFIILLNAPEVAVMLTDPAAAALKLPLASTDATAVFDEVQTTDVAGSLDPSVLMVVAVNCAVVRALMVCLSFKPPMTIDVCKGADTVMSRVPEILL